MNNKIETYYAALILIRILAGRGLINQSTYKNIDEKYGEIKSHILQIKKSIA